MGLLRVCDRSLLPQIIDGYTNPRDHILKRIVMGWPARHRLALSRQHLQLCEWRTFPIARTQDNGQDARLIGFVPGNSLCHLDAIAKVGGHKIGADEQEDDIGSVEMSQNLRARFCPWSDIAIIPG